MVFNKVYDVLKKKFDDGYVNSPLDFKYLIRLQFILSTIGSWPYQKFGKHRLGAILSIFNLFLIVIASIACILSIIYIKMYMDQMSFFFLGHIILCFIFAMLYLSRLVISRTKKFQETIKEYLLEFHLFYFKNRSLYASEIHTQIHTISGMFTIFVFSEMFIGIVLFIFMPWYNNYSRGMFSAHRPENSTFEHSVYFYLPNAVYTTIEGYWILFSLNIYVSYVTTIGLCAFDLLLSLIVFQIWGHLRILKHNLLNMPPPTDSRGMYSIEENDQIRKMLKDNILHHNFIIKFVDRCSDAFSEYLFLFYLIMQFITCILLLEVSAFTADSLAKYGALTLGMHQQLIQVSILFEMINTKSEQLIDAVYSTPWEHMDAGNKRTLLFFLLRMQTPVSLKAAKVVPVGVNTMFASEQLIDAVYATPWQRMDTGSNRRTVLFLLHYMQMPVSLRAAKFVPVEVNTMSAVLKTTFSYYMMLKTLAGER